jgi:hypothetical protein
MSSTSFFMGNETRQKNFKEPQWGKHTISLPWPQVSPRWTRTQDHRSVTGLGRGGTPATSKVNRIRLFFLCFRRKGSLRNGVANKIACVFQATSAGAKEPAEKFGTRQDRQGQCRPIVAPDSSMDKTERCSSAGSVGRRRSLVFPVFWGWQSHSQGAINCLRAEHFPACPGTLRWSTTAAVVTRGRGK